MRGGVKITDGYQPGSWRYAGRTTEDMVEILKRIYSADMLMPLARVRPWPERKRWRGRRSCPHVLGHRFSLADHYCERCGKAEAYATTKMRAEPGLQLMDLIKVDANFG